MRKKQNSNSAAPCAAPSSFPKSNKPFLIAALILLTVCLLLAAVLGVLYVKKASPQNLLAKLGFSYPEEVDWTLNSWNSSLEQLVFDADIVFIGDSLTRGENFQERFPDQKIVNLGISGDTLEGISKRTFVISHLTPEKIFLQGGINSLHNNSVDALAERYETMLVSLMEDNPGAQVFVQSVLPISNSSQTGERTNENIVKLNAALEEIAEKHGATYVDIYSAYALNGEMNPEYTVDGVHLKEAYQYLWLDVLAGYIH